MSNHPQSQPYVWRPQGQFAATITSLRQLQRFNDRGGVPVNFDTMRGTHPDIALTGSQSEILALWKTDSPSGFVTKPKSEGRLITIRFVTSGHIVYRRRSGIIEGRPTHATLVDFDDLLEVQASGSFGAVSGTFEIDALTAAHAALTGGSEPDLPAFEPLAKMELPSLRSLFLTLKQAQYRTQGIDHQDDLIFPLVQEILSYQLLSAWPRRVAIVPSSSRDVPAGILGRALDYIETNISHALTLADLAAAAGTSVRSLQDKFRREMGCTPVQFIIERRLVRAHADLVASAKGPPLPIADIARRWGFVHMSDFAQRYRRLYGHTPSETRRQSC